jgi:glycosyltransferase involved in cell wall biosynthesis
MTKNCIFVADLFSEDYVGGAELTTDALIKRSPYPVIKKRARDLDINFMSDHKDDMWIFGNFVSIDFNLIPAIVANLNYVVLEYDYKFCLYRSIEKHENETGKACDCHEQQIGKIVSAFYHGANHVFWMSSAQRQRYNDRFPFLRDRPSTVLSSVFDDTFFTAVENLKNNNHRNGWIVLGSKSWIKGADAAIKWCQDNDKSYEVIWDLAYDQMLNRLSTAEGFVYLPLGGDTCPRMVIEAKLLGCQVHVNNDVQHASEEWFQRSPDDVCDYLRGRPDVFWGHVNKIIQNEPTLSGYTTTKDCISQGYPWEMTIRSMLGFCDEVIVVDGGSTDGTWEKLQEMASTDDRLVIKQVNRNWDHKRFAVFDGAQKAEARALCTKDFCWQMDADELIHDIDFDKIRDLCKNFPKNIDLICLPVVEYWGSKQKVRMDINPWKWRLSRNLPHITHGIPSHLRLRDANGDLYARQGTDGCDFIHAQTGDVIPFAGFYGEEAHRARIAALSGHAEAQHAYTEWFKNVVQVLPSVRHYSWLDIERKIKTYRGYWQRHWESLYDIRQEDTAENNMFFNKPWREVTDDDINSLATRLADEMGGHIFHTKIDWNRKTPHIAGVE